MTLQNQALQFIKKIKKTLTFELLTDIIYRALCDRMFKQCVRKAENYAV